MCARMRAPVGSEAGQGRDTPSTIDPTLPIGTNPLIPSRNVVLVSILESTVRPLCTLNSLISTLQ